MTRMFLLLRLAYRSLVRSKRRSLLTCSVMLVGLWSCLLLSTFARGMASRLVLTTTEAFVGHVQIHAKGYRDDPTISFRFTEEPVLQAIKQTCLDCVAVSGRVHVPGVLRSERETLGVSVLGIDPDAEQKISFLRHAPIQGSYLEDERDRGVVIGAALLERLKTDIGKRLVLASEHHERGVVERGVLIRGVYRAPLESTEESFVLMGKESLQELIGVPGEVSEISLLLNDREHAEKTVEKLRKKLPSVDVADWREVKPFLATIQSLQTAFLFLWFSIVIGTTGLGLMNTMYMSVMERRREFSLLGALGMSWGSICIQVVFEACILVILAVVGGVVAALLSFWYLSSGIDLSRFAEGAARLGMETVMYPVIIPFDWIVLLCLLSLIGLLATLLPAWLASGIRPGVAIRGE